MRTKKAKSMALGLLLVFTFLSADIAYGLGGGGHSGDGRWDSPQPATPANSNSSSSDVQQAAGGSATLSLAPPQQPSSWTYSSFGAGFECVMIGAPLVPVTLPEPIAALLLGLGVIGLSCMRRKIGK